MLCQIIKNQERLRLKIILIYLNQNSCRRIKRQLRNGEVHTSPFIGDI